jgi:hypothetical protein
MPTRILFAGRARNAARKEWSIYARDMREMPILTIATAEKNRARVI